MLRHIFVAFFSVALLNTPIAAGAKGIKAVDPAQSALIQDFNPTPNPEPGGPTTGSGTR